MNTKINASSVFINHFFINTDFILPLFSQAVRPLMQLLLLSYNLFFRSTFRHCFKRCWKYS